MTDSNEGRKNAARLHLNRRKAAHLKEAFLDRHYVNLAHQHGLTVSEIVAESGLAPKDVRAILELD